MTTANSSVQHITSVAMEAVGVRTLWFFTLFYTFEAQFTNFNVRPRWPHRNSFRRWPVRHHVPLIRDQHDINIEPRFVLLAPNLLRTDSEENIFLEAYRVSEPLTVNITAHNFPEKTVQLLEDTVLLNRQNNYHALKTIKVDARLLDREKQGNQYVYLKADFGVHVAEVVVMLSFHSGYIFIQTDKPLYNPGDAVRYRTFVSTPAFSAFSSSVSIEIQNPDGIVIHGLPRTMASNGIFAEEYRLADIANEGMWKIIAKFDNRPENQFSSEFEVRKYVLPAFNVTLAPRKAYFSLLDTELVVDITASYLYGKPVEGTAYVAFGVEVNKEKRRLPHTMKLLTDLQHGSAVLTIDDIRKVFPNIRDLVGSLIYVKASVLTSTGSDLVEAERTGIKIVESPYKIYFSNTPQYFKPGLPFDVTVEVSHQDGTPAPNVPFQLSLQDEPVTSHSGTARLAVNMPAASRSFTLTAQTKKGGLKPEQQARQRIVLSAYEPFNSAYENYLYISAPDRVSAGDSVNFVLNFKSKDEAHKVMIADFTYLVLNKGKIVEAKRVVRERGQEVINIPFLVTKKMIPSFRLVVYYTLPWQTQTEIVADSVRVDVEDTCVGTLSVGNEDGSRFKEYQPGKSFKFQVRGDPGARVSLLAVDNAIFLLNRRNRFTQGSIWDVVEKRDMGCTPGGGRDSRGVFTDAGLLFYSNNARKTTMRQSVQCLKRTRRRRSVRMLQHRSALESQYQDATLKRCCLDGMREIPMDYTCVRRSHYVTEGWECVRAFLHCCSQYRGAPTTVPPTTTALPMPTSFIGLVAIERHIPMLSARRLSVPETKAEGVSVREFQFDEDDEEGDVEDVDDVVDERSVYVRSKFFETWLWYEVNLPNTTEQVKIDGSFFNLAQLSVESALPDSITEWGILAVSSSADTGFCVARPYNIKSRKVFFVDLRLPRSVARNEQVEVKAVLHNYSDEDMEVIVILYKTEDICSVAFTDNHKQTVTLPAQSSRAIPYTIMPLKAGELDMELKALARDYLGSDGVRKKLRVVVEGIQKTRVQSFILNPSLRGGKDGKQVVRVESIGLDSLVPNSSPETYINVRGSLIADAIDNSISDDALGSLIRMPGGCVEQNLATITLPLIATHYLDKAQQWESVGVQRRLDALTYIKRGYERQLAYRKKDDSYPPYSKEGASTWITAYTVKVFSMAYPIIPVIDDHVCGPLLYLLRERQLPTGVFTEDTPVYDATITGGVGGTESTVTLTAFVMIAMAEAKAVVTCKDPNNPDIDVERRLGQEAAGRLRRLLQEVQRPYTAAIAAYALALVDPRDGRPLLELEKTASPDKTHWPDRENELFTLEATGYALLALVKMGQMERAALPFQWLNDRRRLGGGFGSTQSTMVVLQALAEYLIHKPPPQDLNLRVALSQPGRSDTVWTFQPKTAYVARSAKATIDQTFTLEASGNGQGVLEVVTFYNQLPDVHEKESCGAFDLDVTVKESQDRKTSEDTEGSYRLNINVRSRQQSEVRMVVLDITLPTGFVPDNKDLEMLANSVDRYINNFEIVDGLSDRGSLIIHLFKVSNKETESISFRLLQKFKVRLIQPSSVTVYEYYNPDHRCSKFYNPVAEEAELQRICSNDTCHCAEGNCAVAKRWGKPVDDFTREDEACSGIHHVYKVKVSKVSRSQYDRYEMEILLVIKEGKDEGVQASDRRIFISHSGCREGLDLQEGKEYLIMGPPADIWHQDSSTNRYTYTLGKKSWVEQWPTEAECKSDSGLAKRCTQLAMLTSDLMEKGCLS
ncbi:complement C3-like isoform X1 [Anguilla rostrata]|uniref:complement C3-like isoform X1 n=1 Tax=Anguilla rostrata TaxID=7938 RepID=UPI0030CC487A